MSAKVPSAGVGSPWRLAPIQEQPRAVILDPNCRAPLRKIYNLVRKNEIPPPWIICRDDIKKPREHYRQKYVPLEAHNNGKFKWDDIMSTLFAKNPRTILIEGGGVVINDVLVERIANVVIISISPVSFGVGVGVGVDGVGVDSIGQEPEWLVDVQRITLGKDIVVAGRMKRGERAE